MLNLSFLFFFQFNQDYFADVSCTYINLEYWMPLRLNINAYSNPTKHFTSLLLCMLRVAVLLFYPNSAQQRCNIKVTVMLKWALKCWTMVLTLACAPIIWIQTPGVGNTMTGARDDFKSSNLTKGVGLKAGCHNCLYIFVHKVIRRV